MKTGIILAHDVPMLKADRWANEIEQRLIIRHRMETDVILAIVHGDRHKPTEVDIVLINSTLEQAESAKEMIFELGQ